MNNYSSKYYLGVVEDISDPKKEGRCRVRVYGIFDDLSVSDLPWAYPKHKATIFGQDGRCGSISIPKLNSIVSIQFNNGDIYSPEYYDVHELGEDIKQELNKDDEYAGSHFLLFDGDEDLKIWYTKSKGITMQLKDSRINIAKDSSITIEHKESRSIIELSGATITVASDSQINMTAGSQIKTTTEQLLLDGKFTKVGHNALVGPAVLGDKLFMVLSLLALMIDAKGPPTPGVAQNLIELWEKAVLSDTVTISK